MKEELWTLAARYRELRSDSPAGEEELLDLYRSTVARKERPLLDAIAAAAAMGPATFADHIDFEAVTPQMREAFGLAYPNVPIDSLPQMAPDRLSGIVSGWKGKYFEVMVRDRLNDGLSVGDLHLGAGQNAVLAESATQPGWDLQITDAHGHVADVLQLKASESLAYAKDALERYPDIQVLTTDEAVHGYVGDMIHGTGVSGADLDQAVEAPLEELLDGPLEELVENILPFLPFVIIAVGEGRQVIAGRKAFRDALIDAGVRSAKTGVAMGVGAFVLALDGGWLSLPATLLTRLGIERVHALHRAERAVEVRLTQAVSLRVAYCARGLLEAQ